MTNIDSVMYFIALILLFIGLISNNTNLLLFEGFGFSFYYLDKISNKVR